MSMMRKESAGCYQIGIYAVERVGPRCWLATAVGPGTIGDGSPMRFPTLAAAYLGITGEPRNLNAVHRSASKAEKNERETTMAHKEAAAELAIVPRRYRIRRCEGNEAAWLLVILRDDGSEAEQWPQYRTALSLDALIADADYLRPLPGDSIELVL